MAIDWKEELTIEDDTLTLADWVELWTSNSWPVNAIGDRLRKEGYEVTDNAVGIKRCRLGRQGQSAQEPAPPPEDEADNVVLEHDSPNHLTPEAVMAELGLSLDDWIVVEFRVNEWTTSPSASKNLVSENGRWTGTVVRGRDDAQYWSYSIKIKPKIVEPREVSFRFLQAQPYQHVPDPAPAESSTIKNWLIFGDAQIGFTSKETYHDRRALDIVAKIAMHAGKLDGVICVGDYVDLDCWQSRFAIDPEAVGASQRTVCEGHYWWWRLAEAAPTARRVLIEGNHDARLGHAIENHLREACGLRTATNVAGWPIMSVPYLLDLDALKVEYLAGYPANPLWLTDWLRVVHGTAFSASPGQTARKLLQGTDVNTVAGHSHRNERASRTIHTRYGQQEITAAVVGCTCKIDGTVPGRSPEPQWQQGALWVTFDTGNPHHIEFQEIRINEGSALFRGKVYTGAAERIHDDLIQIYPEVDW